MHAQLLFVFSILSFFLLGCDANTIDVSLADQSSSGVVLPKVPEGETFIDVGAGEGLDLPDVPQTPNQNFAELFEVGRASLQLESDHIAIDALLSFYQGRGPSGELGHGVYILAGSRIVARSRVRMYLTDRVIQREEFTARNIPGRYSGYIDADRSVTKMQLSGVNDSAEANAILLVCDDSEGSHFCGASELIDAGGELSGDFVRISHARPRGSVRLFRSPENYNLIFQTSNDYFGEDGPNLFFYLSTEDFDPTVGSREDLYSRPESSIVVDPTPIGRNSGQYTIEIPNSANQLANLYKTASVWCEEFAVLFYIAEVK